MIDLPAAFLEEMQAQLGDETGAFAASYTEEPLRGVRMNPMKRPLHLRPDGIGDPVPWCSDGYYLSGSSRCGLQVLHEAGAWYLQEPSAMLPAAVLDVQPGETVLDLCAAPGGKTTQLAAAMQGNGLLVANEIVPKRAQILSRNVERMGVSNALVISADPAQIAKKWPEGFDAVLVDAPCSGEGMFRRHPETRDEWSVEAVHGCCARQREILNQAAGLVRGGGRLVYSTCTMNRLENEENVEWFLKEHPDFALDAFEVQGVDGSRGYFTCYPHRLRGEGQFAARFVKREGDFSSISAPVRCADEKMVRTAIGQAVHTVPSALSMLGSTIFSLNGCPDLRGLRVLRAGVHLGEIRKGVFTPDHAWAVSTCPPEVEKVEITEEEAIRYLQGETLQVCGGRKGYVLPVFDGLALGWGKVTGDMMKNHYPKGLRRLVDHS